ncbi:hypothetical protein ANCCAN_13633 [Ancylostoma caninum]|uniref:Uncharacterized protein n=1 Tax=Ancylostoma caninum TaxID=29170 RepID=A0A368G7W3_ANCCA|nr:hypothetical protein ANCCAN_13633 [Ancylostoma caninum]
MVLSKLYENLEATDEDDLNARSCIDPVLRSEIKSALNSTDEISCKDFNFYYYVAELQASSLHLAKIDGRVLKTNGEFD